MAQASRSYFGAILSRAHVEMKKLRTGLPATPPEHFHSDGGDAVGTDVIGEAPKFQAGSKKNQTSPEGLSGPELNIKDICRPICPCVFYCIEKKRKKRSRRPVRPRDEHVFYDSSTFKRSWLGACHHKLCCPPWNKITSTRVVGTVWAYTECCGMNCRSGRVTDTFMADL